MANHDHPRGMDLLHDPALNKGTAFTEEERDALGLRGLLPPRVNTVEEQEQRVLENLRGYADPLGKYVYLTSLQDRNERLFYRIAMRHTDEIMPLIYTPVVGQACKQFGHLFRRARGMYITRHDRGRIADVLRNWPEKNVDIVCVTDGERILGLGDLGASGMGIPIGKLSLYTVCAAVPPARCLPVMLDTGTNNQDLLHDPLYLGVAERRLRGEEYDALVEEFVNAVQEVFPGAMVHFEDFANANAFRLLRKYAGRICSFNDDVQGTGAVTLSGLFTAAGVLGKPLRGMKFVFMGAGEAAIGIADLIVEAMVKQGLPEAAARAQIWLVDSKGLVCSTRADLQEHKRGYAHDVPACATLLEAIGALKPDGIIGVCGQHGAFSEDIVRAMGALNARPIIFALSNPTSSAECTAEQAYQWSSGRALFASGSPFAPVTLNGQTFVPGQSNNAYIFPAIGLAKVAFGLERITGEMFYTAAETLAGLVSPGQIEKGCLYPPLSEIRAVSKQLALAIGELAVGQGLATRCDGPLERLLEAVLYTTDYSAHDAPPRS
jgi:malate dehydrogenase (oxaloacetate-decarboxylating)(NADP+)